jgi:hypothetical protein
MSFIPKIDKNLNENSSSQKTLPWIRNFYDANYDDFQYICTTGLSDTSLTNYCGADIGISEKAIHVVGTELGVPGQMYSLSKDMFNLSKELNMNTINSPTVIMNNPSTLVTSAANYDNVYVVGFSSSGGLGAYAFRSVLYPTGYNVSVANPGGEDWSGARACIIAKNWNDSSTSYEPVYYWTAPIVNKVYARRQFSTTVVGTTFSGETPTAVCADNNGYLWVSFVGTGKVRKYHVGNDTIDFGVMTLISTYSVPQVQEMIFDGKYIWCFSSQTSRGDIYKIDSNTNGEGVVSTLSLTTALGSTAAITNKSRACFDGSAIWLTRQNTAGLSGNVIKIDAVDKNIRVSILPVTLGGQPRGIAADKNGNIYLAAYNGSNLSIQVRYPGNSEIPLAPIENNQLWLLNQYGMPSTFNFWNQTSASMGGIYQKGTVEFDIYAVRSGSSANLHYAHFKFFIDYEYGASGFVNTTNIISPVRVGNASVYTWNVTFSYSNPNIIGTLTIGSEPLTGILFWVNSKFRSKVIDVI